MNAKERAGRRIYLILATLFILEKLAGIVLTMAGAPAGEVNWLKSVVQPIVYAAAVGFLFYGDNTIRWLVGGGSIFEGALTTYLMGFVIWALYARTPPDKMDVFRMAALPFGMILVFGVLHILMGLIVLLWPSLQAFFRYQREGSLSGVYVGPEGSDPSPDA